MQSPSANACNFNVCLLLTSKFENLPGFGYLNTHIFLYFRILTLRLLRGWWGRCKKEEGKGEGREGGEKKWGCCPQGRGSNLGPATC